MLDTDIKTYHAAEVSALATNGGRMSVNQVISGVVNNVWPHVPRAERLAGAVLHRKLFDKAADDTDGTLLATQKWIDRPTLGEDRIVAFAGTQTDTQADITGNERKYGAAYLKTDIAAGVSTFVVTVEDAALASGTDAIFQDGDPIRLTNMATPDAATGTEEFLTISGAPTVLGLDVTITVAEVIANPYTVVGESRAMSIMDKGDIACSVENFQVTAAGTGAYDNINYPVICDNIGTVEDSITLQFTDATHFNVIGSSGIAYGSGDTATDFSPSNPDFTKPYFTLEAAGFSGIFAAGDAITWDIHPAAFAYWLRRTVPAGCASLANNKLTAVTAGESAV
ncbi:MAG: hypothetical protein KKA76_18030 [Proteobacteria bacterium]|nr:hypothetical protein [Pseudomonadota bacterium]